MASFASELFLFCSTATFFTWRIKLASSTKDGERSSIGSCDALQNSAFVFVKPHANTLAVQNLVRTKLTDNGIRILSEREILASSIDEKKLIDQHYYSIASKATIIPGREIPVPKEKFMSAFGESYDTVLKEGRICNALEACAELNCTPAQLDAAWQQTTAVKFGGGFYCGLVSIGSQKRYVFNAFFMSMRSKLVAPGTSIACFEVEWNPAHLSWADFRSKVLGPTDPQDAPAGSLRQLILQDYQALGLSSIPNKGDNGVHASASPFEGLAEKLNWLGMAIEDQTLGKLLLDAGVSRQTIKDWCVDPRVALDEKRTMGSLFDALEDLNVEDCLAKLVHLNDVNNNVI